MHINKLNIIFALIFIFTLLSTCLINTKENLRKNLKEEDEEYDRVQAGKIPYLSFLTLKVSYFQELVKFVKDFESFKTYDSEDQSFRVNLMTFPTEEANKKDIVVFFRGTEFYRIKNLMADFDLREVELEEGCKGCLIQMGYLKAFDFVEQKTFEFIRDEIVKIKSEGNEINLIYFSGHSLGGAMAELAAHFFLTRQEFHLNENPYLEDIKKISLITFGTPKVGNEDFNKRMENDKRLLDNVRVVYGIDDVPFFPFQVLKRPQSHNGDLIYFWQKDYVNYDTIIGFNRGHKIQNGFTPDQYLKEANNLQRKIRNLHDRVLDHLRYFHIAKETLSNAIMSLRKMQGDDESKETSNEQ